MTRWTQGVDASYAELTPAIAGELRDAGVAVWWQCLWTGSERPASAIANLEVARAAGLIVAGYCSVTERNPGWWHANHARDGVPDDLWNALRVVPCDVELAGIPNDTIRQCVEQLAQLGKRCAIYTSYGAWTANQGDTRDFGDCLLCNAAWDGRPDVNFAALPFGGWSIDAVLLEQYTGGTEVSGILVDRDTWNLDLLDTLGTEGDMDAPTKGEFGALYRLVGAHYDVTIAIADALFALASHVYGADDPALAQFRVEIDAMKSAATSALAALPPAQPP